MKIPFFSLTLVSNRIKFYIYSSRHKKALLRMPIQNSWYIEGRVLLTELIGDVTVDEMVISSQQGTAIIESGTAPVYNLVDVTRLGHFPLKLNDLRQVFSQGTSEKLEWVFLIGLQNVVVKFLATTFVQLMKRNYLLVNTVEDALQAIDKLEKGGIARK